MAVDKRPNPAYDSHTPGLGTKNRSRLRLAGKRPVKRKGGIPMIITPDMTLQEQANLVSQLYQAWHKAGKAVDEIPKSHKKEYDSQYDLYWELQNVFHSVMDDLLRLGIRSPYEDWKMFVIRAGTGEL
jgi:hypothetical protein